MRKLPGMTQQKLRVLTQIFGAAALFCVCTLSCGKPAMTAAERAKGALLAQQYCASCHMLPQPAELDANSWKMVLDSMGEFLGMRRENSSVSLFENPKAVGSVKPQIAQTDWQVLRQYFVSQSANRPQPIADQAPACSQHFKAVPVDYALPGAIITWVEIDPICQCIHFADASRGELLTADFAGKITRRLKIGYAVTGAATLAGSKYFVAAKNLLPNDDATGILFTLIGDRVVILQNDLIRPVFLSAHNGKLIVSEFGNLSGRLSAFSHGGKSTRKILSEKPGYMATTVDRNNNLIALRAQADEAIVHIDDAKNAASENILIRFSPTWGSTSMQYSQLGTDKKEFLITSHGDNGDLPTMPYKPQHGIRIYEKTGAGWVNTFFYLLPGAYKVMATDLDADGQTDMAAIAYFTTKAPQESPTFRLLLRRNNTFEPCSVPEADSGQWITMDVRDGNRDGRSDIVLGAAYTDQFKLSTVKGRHDNIVILLSQPTQTPR